MYVCCSSRLTELRFYDPPDTVPRLSSQPISRFSTENDISTNQHESKHKGEKAEQTGVSGKTRSAAILTSPGVDHFLSSDFRTFFIGCSTFCSHKSHADQLEILALRSTVKCHRSHQCWNEEKLHRKTYSYPPTDTHTL